LCEARVFVEGFLRLDPRDVGGIDVEVRASASCGRSLVLRKEGTDLIVGILPPLTPDHAENLCLLTR